jgi:hypothetical protein
MIKVASARAGPRNDQPVFVFAIDTGRQGTVFFGRSLR